MQRTYTYYNIIRISLQWRNHITIYIANLLSSILTILLTCPNNDTLLCYSNDPLLTVYSLMFPVPSLLRIMTVCSLKPAPSQELIAVG